jgi:hypothetical protein
MTYYTVNDESNHGSEMISLSCMVPKPELGAKFPRNNLVHARFLGAEDAVSVVYVCSAGRRGN